MEDFESELRVNNMIQLQTEDQLDELAGMQSCLVFKHSLTCPISKGAFEQFKAYMEEQQSIPAYYLYIQESRPLSDLIAQRFEIRHESPQVLYIRNGNVIWSESHWNITKKSLQEHIS